MATDIVLVCLTVVSFAALCISLGNHVAIADLQAELDYWSEWIKEEICEK